MLAALDAFPALAEPELHLASDAALLGLVPALADYPPEPVGSRYRRTGTLGRLWAAARPEFATLSSGWEATLQNATPYGPYVQDAARQARMHRGRWTTDEAAIDGQRPAIEAAYDAAAERIADALDRLVP